MLSCSSTCKSVSFQLPTWGLPDQWLQNRFGSSTSIYNPSSYVYGFDHNIKSHWNKVTKPARNSQVLFLFLFSVSIHQVFVMPSVCYLIVTYSFVKKDLFYLPVTASLKPQVCRTYSHFHQSFCITFS